MISPRSNRRRPRPLALVPLLALALLVAIGAAGCAKSCKNDRPYVPYAVGDAPTSAPTVDDDAGAAQVDSGGPPGFAEQAAVVAPANVAQWTLEGLSLTAPEGRIFVLGLVRDFDGDGARDAVAIVRRASAPPAPAEAGELVFYKGRPPAAVDAPVLVATAPPPAVPSDPACAATARLGQVGRHSVLAEIVVACAGRQPPSPSRSVAVVSLLGAPRVQFSANVADPPGTPKLTLDADGSDHDEDGIDDVALRITIEGGTPPFEPGPRVGAVLRWFDRPAGMSRDPNEPDASLRALAGGANARAARVKDAASVPVFAQQLRALYAAICNEGGGPRITNVLGGAPVSCGPSRGLEEAGLAEVRAFTVSGDPLRAISAFERAQRAPATKTASRTNDALGWLAQVAPAATAAQVRAVSAVPQIDRGRAPAWGALAFEASGKLLVRTAAGVVRVDPALGDEAEADGVTAWKSAVLSPDGGSRWIEAYNPCNGPAIHATFAPTGDGDPHDVSLPVAWPLGVRCATAKGEPVAAQPIAWGARGLEAVVAGEPVLIAPDFARASAQASSLDQPVSLGAPRSPNGKLTVTPTSQGILVRGAKSRLHRTRELDGGYLELRDCVVSDDMTRIAFVRGGRAFVSLWETP